MVGNDDSAYQEYGDANGCKKDYNEIPVNGIVKAFR
jgi:hypothetical protein